MSAVPLTKEHAARLASFRIPSELLEAAGVRSVTDFQARELLGVNGHPGDDLSGILFPYVSPSTGQRVGARIRLDTPLHDDGKYLSEMGCRHFFFPPGAAELLHDPTVPVVFVEAEKSALALWALAERAGRPMLLIAFGGCWGWRRKVGNRTRLDGRTESETGPGPDFDLISLKGRPAILAFDSNARTHPDVQKARRALARELSHRESRVLIAEVPDHEGVNGPDDLIAVLGDDATLRVLDAAIAANRQERESAATQLLGLTRGCIELFHSGENCYATITVADHRETHALNSHGFRLWLTRKYYEQYRRAPTDEAVRSSIATLEGEARFDGEERTVFVRLAPHDQTIYLDLCDKSWRVVEIGKNGWTIIDSNDCPVRFRRARGMLALPGPEQGGTIDELQRSLNLGNKNDFVLAVSWLLGAFQLSGPYPVLILNGQQGSAKSTTAAILRSLIDPNVAPRRTAPRDARDLMIAANNAFVCSFDNLSCLHHRFSDMLCRLSTGGGYSTRKLYTDDEETIFEAKRPAILNGIEELATRGDLLDRSVILYLPRLADDKRRYDAEVWDDFNAAQPRLLGAVLDAVSAALRDFNSVKLRRLPRMADFARWIVAAEPALGWAPGTFLFAYEENREMANYLPLETPVADAVRKLALPWKGSASELLAALEFLIDERTRRSKSWPTNGKSLSNALRRLAPNLQEVGIIIEFGRDNSRVRNRIICITSERTDNPSPERDCSMVASLAALRGASSDFCASSSGIPDDADDEKQLLRDGMTEEPL